MSFYAQRLHTSVSVFISSVFNFHQYNNHKPSDFTHWTLESYLVSAKIVPVMSPSLLPSQPFLSGTYYNAPRQTGGGV